MIRAVIPPSVLNLKHFFYAWYGAVKYAHPSEKLYVVGVTGTSGKSSTIYLLRQIFEEAGYRVGSLSTVDFYVDGEQQMNDRKMTMLGRMDTQRYLRRMVDQGCDIAIIEATSEGAVQHRHRFINFDMMILTNLYPEHIESHGSFENYKKAKQSIFCHVAKSPRKKTSKLSSTLQKCFGPDVEKIIIVNGNSEHSRAMLSYGFEKRVAFGRGDSEWLVPKSQTRLEVKAEQISIGARGITFNIDDTDMSVQMYGEYNIMNILAAVAAARSLHIAPEVIKLAVSQFQGVPGRIEFIPEARAFGFDVVVDYAFEPVAMEELYKAVTLLEPKRIIHVLGSTGGGRDKARRFSVGEMVGKRADICIVTNEDPYDDDPVQIIEDVAHAIASQGKVLDETLFQILDRREAVLKAVELAEPGDIILLSGKGSEQKMCVAGGKMIDWDDREVVRESLARLSDDSYVTKR